MNCSASSDATQDGTATSLICPFIAMASAYVPFHCAMFSSYIVSLVN